MKITKAQSLANRERIVETASTLFREHGYDGVSVADLMVAAGFTHGGFYKHFDSKAALMAEATEHGLAAKMDEYKGLDMPGFIDRYLSRAHRDDRAGGCSMAALCSDASRQPDLVKATFGEGLAQMVAAVERGAMASGADSVSARAGALGLFSQMIGALVLSRACPDDSPLSEEILDVCRRQMLAATGSPDAGRTRKSGASGRRNKAEAGTGKV